MRVTVTPGGTVSPVLTKRNDGKLYMLVIRVIDPITVYFSTKQADLQSTDAAGNPLGGLPLSNTSTAVPFVLPFFGDDLFMRGGQQGNVEIQLVEFYDTCKLAQSIAAALMGAMQPQ